jgi:hypothetical protein
MCPFFSSSLYYQINKSDLESLYEVKKKERIFFASQHYPNKYKNQTNSLKELSIYLLV